MSERGSRDEQFRDFVVGSGPRLQRTAFLLCGDWGVAEDMVQSALARAYSSWDRVGGLEQPEAYVRRVMVNQRVSWWRRHRHLQEVPTAWLPETPTQRSDQVGDRDGLRAALLALGARQRAAVVLRYYCDLSEQDTAAALGCSVGNVKSLTSRGVARLRQLLEDDKPAEGLHA
jgi:RNA polymerase sigma-70 factor (sigma-E family)